MWEEGVHSAGEDVIIEATKEDLVMPDTVWSEDTSYASTVWEGSEKRSIMICSMVGFIRPANTSVEEKEGYLGILEGMLMRVSNIRAPC